MLQEQYANGKTEGQVKLILDLLGELPDGVSEELRAYLISEKDCNVLRRYHKLATSASSVEEFARQIRQ